MRPKKCRNVQYSPKTTIYKPAGIPLRDMNAVILELAELEALRLVDLEGMYQNEACEKMGISRSTLGRIVTSAHQKVAQALVEGKAIVIEANPE